VPKSTISIKRSLYPAIEAWSAEHLDAGSGHHIYVEQSGNRDGIPVIFVHGGPGGGTSPMQRRYFNPEKYRIILFDQRGCGRSRPHANLENNTTWHLIADMEMIRHHLGIKRWIVFGGSWGSTLSLIYSQKHPDFVMALVLRGIFLGRTQELKWLYGGGTRSLFPEGWKDFAGHIPQEEQDDLISAYYKRLTSPNKKTMLEAAYKWAMWESNAVTLMPDIAAIKQNTTADFAIAISRIEAHYFVNNCFLDRENQILEDIKKISHIPIHIIQGRYDAVCPPISAWDLYEALPSATLHIVPVAGHSAFEPDIIHYLVSTMDQLGEDQT
jgi:proline iminopeptidase